MGCITNDYKTIVRSMVEKEMHKDLILGVIDTIPACTKETADLEIKAREAAKRKVPGLWGLEPIYFNEKGEEKKYNSPSALIKELGLPMSGIQCDVEGNKCRAQSAVEILRIHGYTVSGNGEPKRASEGGKVLKVYHPLAPQLKKE